MSSSALLTAMSATVFVRAAAFTTSIQDGESLRRVFAKQLEGSLATWTAGSDPCEGHTWEGIKCDRDMHGYKRVKAVGLRGFGLRGEIDLGALQPMDHLSAFSVAGDGKDHQTNRLSGSVDLTRLPINLKKLYLESNRFTGSADFTRLPTGLHEIDISINLFSGPVDLTRLPSHLDHCIIDSNFLTGAVDLTKLPAGLTRLEANRNAFTRIEFPPTPPTHMQSLHLEPFNGWMESVCMEAAVDGARFHEKFATDLPSLLEQRVCFPDPPSGVESFDNSVITAAEVPVQEVDAGYVADQDENTMGALVRLTILACAGALVGASIVAVFVAHKRRSQSGIPRSTRVMPDTDALEHSLA